MSIRKHLQSGFSLIELIVAVAITMVVAVLVSQFEADFYQFNTFFSGRLQAIDQARKLLRPLASEVRGATDSYAGDFALNVVDEDEFIFFSDIDLDGDPERVRYTFANGQLEKGTIEPFGDEEEGYTYPTADEVVITYIDFVVNEAGEPVFEYFDDSYTGSENPLSQPVTSSEVRLVKITLFVDATAASAPGRAELTTQTAIRNLKSNL